MELNYNVVSFLDAVGFVQGLTLGSIILIMNRNRHRSTFFLGLFLIIYSLKLLRFIEVRLGLGEVYPSLLFLPFNFTWLLFPLFFVYCQKISFFSNQKTHYWVLYPGIASFLAQVVIFFLPHETKVSVSESFWHLVVFNYLGIFYAWAIGIWNFVLLYRHKIAVNNYYSMVESRELNWAQVFLIYSLISSWISHLLVFIEPETFNYRILFSIFDLIAIAWIAVFGLQQHNAHILLREVDLKNSDYKSTVKSQKVPFLDMPALQNIIRQVDEIMTQQQLYLNENLTIVDIAKSLDQHPKKISIAINKVQDKNFNIYVNEFRVNKAKQLLENYEDLNLSIEGVGNESGFRSKSAFYSSFKKVTGLTPTEYKNQFSITV